MKDCMCNHDSLDHAPDDDPNGPNRCMKTSCPCQSFKAAWHIEVPISGYGWSSSEYGDNLSILEDDLKVGVEYIATLEKPCAPDDVLKELSEDEVEEYYPSEGLILVIRPKV